MGYVPYDNSIIILFASAQGKMDVITGRNYLRMFVPKLFTVLSEGYGWRELRGDAVAGLTVAIVALPLAMALAIASGTTPEKGLYTAIVAGFLISALGGSRVQIGGPTAAFIPVVFVVIQKFGFGGMVLCTLLAGLMLIGAGLLRLGTLMKYMPQPVITGFTAGIAVSIFSSQVKDALGLTMTKVPGGFLDSWTAYLHQLPTARPAAVALTLVGLAVIAATRRWRPGWPAFLIALLACTALSVGFALPAETIGSRFGGLPSSLPTFNLPHIPFERTRELLPSAFTIAFLAGVESLLSAVVADGMTGGRHRSNGELVAQGLANVGSALFGGLPATGAIARTATNIRAGGRTPLAGMIHAVLLLLFMLVLAPLMKFVPLAALSATLLVVAWNMSEIDHFRHTLSAPKGDGLVLLLTFGLTVLFNLTIAIEVGLVVSAFVFMFRMADVVEVTTGIKLIDENGDDRATDSDTTQRAQLPPGVEVFQISGPLFFGAANRLDDLLDQFQKPPQVFILRMRLVPIIDASGVHALKTLLERCRRRGIILIISGLQPQPQRVIRAMAFHPHEGELYFVDNYEKAVALSEELNAANPFVGPEARGTQ
jgi:SulP family sulfate permease